VGCGRLTRRVGALNAGFWRGERAPPCWVTVGQAESACLVRWEQVGCDVAGYVAELFGSQNTLESRHVAAAGRGRGDDELGVFRGVHEIGAAVAAQSGVVVAGGAKCLEYLFAVGDVRVTWRERYGSFVTPVQERRRPARGNRK